MLDRVLPHTYPKPKQAQFRKQTWPLRHCLPPREGVTHKDPMLFRPTMSKHAARPPISSSPMSHRSKSLQTKHRTRNYRSISSRWGWRHHTRRATNVGKIDDNSFNKLVRATRYTSWTPHFVWWRDLCLEPNEKHELSNDIRTAHTDYYTSKTVRWKVRC